MVRIHRRSLTRAPAENFSGGGGLNRYFSSNMGVKSKKLAVSARLYGQNKKISPVRGGSPGPTLPISAGGGHTVDRGAHDDVIMTTARPLTTVLTVALTTAHHRHGTNPRPTTTTPAPPPPPPDLNRCVLVIKKEQSQYTLTYVY